MSERTLRIVGWSVAALVLLYAGVTLLASRTGSASAPDAALARALEALDTARLDSVLVQGPAGERVVLRAGPGHWTVNGLPADSGAVARLREALGAAEAGGPVATNPVNHERLGVAAQGAWRAAFHAGNSSLTLLLGKPGASYTSTYARLPDSDEVHLVEGGLGGAVTRTVAEWRDHTIAKVDAALVRTLVLERDGETLVLERSQGGWRSAEAQGPPADSAAVAGVLSELARLQATGFVDSSSAVAAAVDSVESHGSAAQPARPVRRLTALGARNDTLARLELQGTGTSTWRVRAAGDTTLYELSSWVADRLVPTRGEVERGGGG